MLKFRQASFTFKVAIKSPDPKSYMQEDYAITLPLSHKSHP